MAVDTIARGMAANAAAGDKLPAVSASDNGKVLVVQNGAWAAGDEPSPNLDTLSVTENGTYTPESPYVGFSEVDVDVQASLGTLNATANGTYNASDDGYDGYNVVNVDVQASASLGTLNATANGTYNAFDDGYDGYNVVNVDVQASLGTLNATANGTYNASDDGYYGYDTVNVNVDPYVFTASGTVANPWDSTIPAAMAGILISALNAMQASATLDVDASALGLGTFRTTARMGITGDTVLSFCLADLSSSSAYQCMEITYDSTGSLTVCASVQGGTYTDMTQYASVLTTTLTVSTLLNPGV